MTLTTDNTMRRGFRRVYLWGEAFTRGALRVTPPGLMNNTFEITRAEVRPIEPLVFVAREGSRPLDLIGVEYPELDLVSDRVVQALQDANATGWTTYPVKVLDARGEEIKGYQGLAVTGRCGAPDNPDRFQPWHAPPALSDNPYKWMSTPYFNPDTWDGSDIFVPRGTALILVVDRVRQALRKARVRNIDFKLVMEVVEPREKGG